MEKKKTYVLILSKNYPNGHSNKLYPTYFREKFLLGQGCPDCNTPQDLSGENVSNCNSCVRAGFLIKLHTIRTNYPLWKRRIKEIQEGIAVLSIRQWIRTPYRSKQIEIAQLAAENGINIQKLQFDGEGIPSIEGKYIDSEVLANNDGMSLKYWKEWLKSYDTQEPLAIIHFTRFIY